MKTKLPAAITTQDEAEDFLNELFENGEHFHPEEDAENIINLETKEAIFTSQEAKKLNQLMGVMLYEIADFDPCEYLEELREEEERRNKLARPEEF